MILEKNITFLWALFAIGLGATIPTNEDESGGLCLTKTCIQLASQLFDNMNMKADPCQDFYEFTCGNFVIVEEIPKDKGEMNSFGKVVEIFEKRGKTLLEKDPSEGDWEIFKHFRNYYKACMNVTAIEEKTLPLIKSKLESMGDWPILKGDNWSEDDFDVETFLVASFAQGFLSSSLFKLFVGFDIKSNNSHIIQLDQPSFGISRLYLANGLEQRSVQAYLRYMSQVALHFGANPEDLSELDKVLELEMDLAGIALGREKRRDPNALYKKVFLRDVPSRIISSWPDLIGKILENNLIAEEENVIIKDPEYFRNLDAILEKYSKRTLANYLGWRMIQSVDSYLDGFVVDAKQDLFKTLYGKPAQPARWKMCVKSVGFNNYDFRSYQIGVGSMYVQAYFPPQAREIIRDMYSRIRNTFSKLITDSDWMDEETLVKAQTKLDHMDQMIGYPDELLDEDKVSSLYQGLQLSDDQYLQNYLNGIKNYNQRNYQKLRKFTSDYKWEILSKSALVNAFYNTAINSVMFNAAFLQGAFFQADAPMYQNFGGVGIVIGHEITHGFDGNGRKFDHKGNLKNWWNNATDEAFDVKAQCFVDLFNGLEVEEIGMKVNGRLTLGENIADFVGVRSSHATYEKFLVERGQDLMLPGLPFTPMQYFWIFYGQSWCSVIREKTMISNIFNDNHSPPKFRINVPLSHYEGFAKDFGCKASDKMVEENPCRMW